MHASAAYTTQQIAASGRSVVVCAQSGNGMAFDLDPRGS